MAELRVHPTPLRDPETLARRWRALEGEAAATAFTAWAWIGSWLATLAVDPWLVEVRRGGDVVALAVVCPRRLRRHGLLAVRTLHLHATGDPVRDAVTVEYNDLLARPEEAVAARRAVAAVLLDRRWWGPPCTELHLPGLAAATAGWTVAGGIDRLHARRPSARIRLDAVGEDYLAGLRPGVRRRLRRSMRLYERMHGPLRLRPAPDAATALAWLDALAALHVARWRRRGRPSAFAREDFRTFHRRLVAGAPEVGRLFRLDAGGTPLGFLYLLCWRDHAFFYAGGFDFPPDNRLKPGLVAHALAVARLRAEGFRVYDLGAGSEPYKAELAAPGPDIVHRVLARSTAPLRLEHALRQLRARLRAATGGGAVG